MSEFKTYVNSQGDLSNIPFAPGTGWHRVKRTLDIPYQPYSNKRIAVASMPRGNAIKTQTKKRKKKTKKGHEYHAKIPRLVANHRMGLIKWVGDDAVYQPAATSGRMIFHMNDLSDPGGAHSAQLPQWWTEISGIYKRYKVLSCKWEIRFINVTASIVQGAYCYAEETEAPPDSAAGLTEGIQKGRMFDVGATDENYSNHQIIYGMWALKHHMKKNVMGDDYGATVTTAPARVWCLVVNVGSAANVDLKYRAIMELCVELNDLQQNAPD